MSCPKFIFVTWLPDYFELPVVSPDIDGFEGSDNIKFIFHVHIYMCVCTKPDDVPVFSLRLFEVRQQEPSPFILYVIYLNHIQYKTGAAETLLRSVEHRFFTQEMLLTQSNSSI